VITTYYRSGTVTEPRGTGSGTGTFEILGTGTFEML